MAGSLAAGAAIERVSAKRLLIALYALRAIGVAAFLALPKTEFNVLAFAVWMGLTYMATLAPTSSLIARRFGNERFATLFGVVMLVHQVGAFLGVWLGGVALEATGGLDRIWYADIALAIGTAALYLPLREPKAAAARPELAAQPDGRARCHTGAAAAPRCPRLEPVTFAMPDGRVISIRAIVAHDRDRVAAFVRGLTPQSRRRRFFSAIRELSAAMLDRLIHPDPARERVLVAVSGAGPNRRIVGIAQVAPTDDAEDCEFALVIADDLQGQGLGMRMMDALIDAARAAGYREVVGDVLTDNHAMLALARRAGFESRSSKDPMLTRIVRAVGNRSSALGLGRFPLRAGGAAIAA